MTKRENIEANSIQILAKIKPNASENLQFTRAPIKLIKIFFSLRSGFMSQASFDGANAGKPAPTIKIQVK